MTIVLLVLAAVLLLLHCITAYGNTTARVQATRISTFLQDHAKAVTKFFHHQEERQQETIERQKESIQFNRRQRQLNRTRDDLNGRMTMEILAR